MVGRYVQRVQPSIVIHLPFRLLHILGPMMLALVLSPLTVDESAKRQKGTGTMICAPVAIK